MSRHNQNQQKNGVCFSPYSFSPTSVTQIMSNKSGSGDSKTARSRWAEIKGAGHWLHTQKPDEVEREVTAF